jgi:hypothetical protein
MMVSPPPIATPPLVIVEHPFGYSEQMDYRPTYWQWVRQTYDLRFVWYGYRYVDYDKGFIPL